MDGNGIYDITDFAQTREGGGQAISPAIRTALGDKLAQRGVVKGEVCGRIISERPHPTKPGRTQQLHATKGWRDAPYVKRPTDA